MLTFDRLEERVLLAVGDLDVTFGEGGRVTTDFQDVFGLDGAYAVEMLSDGSIIAAGVVVDDDGGSPGALVKFLANGTVDTTFGDGGKVVLNLDGRSFRTENIAVDDQDRIVVVGSVGTMTAARLLANGEIDLTFGGGDGWTAVNFGVGATANAVAITATGNIVLAGMSGNDFAAAQLTETGVLDLGFGGGDGVVTVDFGSSGDVAYDAAITASGKIVLAGKTVTSGNELFAVAQLTALGVLDTAGFGAVTGKATVDFGAGFEEAIAVAITGSGSIVVAGRGGNDFSVAQLTSTGGLDTNFSGDGKATVDFAGKVDLAYDVVVRSTGQIVVAGHARDALDNINFGVAQLTALGALDTTFGSGTGTVQTDFAGGFDVVLGVALTDTGDVIAAGQAFLAGHAQVDFALAKYTPAGILDSGFGAGDGTVTFDLGYNAREDVAQAIVRLDDGSFVLGGSSEESLGRAGALARFLADGTLDTTFGDNGTLLLDLDGETFFITGLAADNLGRIIVVGGLNADMGVVRLLANGAFDTSFGGGDGWVAIDFAGGADSANAVKVTGAGSILVAGFATESASGGINFAAAQITSTGDIDGSFGGGDGKVSVSFSNSSDIVTAVAFTTGGDIVLAGTANETVGFLNFAAVRLSSAGVLDSGFGTGGKVTVDFGSSDQLRAVAVSEDGDIVLAGQIPSSMGENVAVAQLTSVGVLDSAFGVGGKLSFDVGGSHDSVYAAAITPAGKILLGGYASEGSNGTNFALFQFDSTGQWDTTFGGGDGLVTLDFAGSSDLAKAMAFTSTGDILLAGQTGEVGGFNFAVARFTSSGAVDSAFGGGDGKATVPFDYDPRDDVAAGFAQLADGSFLIAGTSTDPENPATGTIARYLANGSLDPSFGAGGRVQVEFNGRTLEIRDIAVDGEGRIVMIGRMNSNFAVARFLADGAVDTEFGGGDGWVTVDVAANELANAVAIRSTGEIVVAGFAGPLGNANFAVIQLTVEGNLDLSFGDNGVFTHDFAGQNDIANALAITSSGKIILAGSVQETVGGQNFGVLQLTAGGILDSSFGGGDGLVTIDFATASDSINAIAITADDKVLLVGSATVSGSLNFAVAQLTPAGVLDSSGFGGGTGKLTVDFSGGNDIAFAVLTIDQGGILLAGQATGAGFNVNFGVARLDSQGAMESNFGVGGKVMVDFAGGVDIAIGAAITPFGRLLLAGTATSDITVQDYAAARLELNTAPVATNDDFSVGEDATSITGNLITGNNGNGLDSDVEGDNLTIVSITVDGDVLAVDTLHTLDNGAILQVNSDGSFSFTLNNAFQGLDDTESDILSIGYTLSDGHFGEHTAGVTVTVSGANDAPVADDRILSVDEHAPATSLGLEAPLDADNEMLTITVTGQPTFGVVQKANGDAVAVNDTITAADLEALNYVPIADFYGSAGSFTYTVSDGTMSDTGTVTINVTAVNDEPTATVNAYVVSENSAVNGNVLTDGTPDSDPDDAANTLVVSAVNGVGGNVGTQITLGSGALLIVNADGSYSYNPTPGFGGLFAGQTAIDSFTYTISDPGGLTSTATVTITINGVSPGITINGNTAAFIGTAGIDSFTYNVATRIIRVGSTPYVLPVNIDLVTIDGLGARDLLSVLGTAGANTAQIGQGTLNFEHNAAHAGFDLTGINLETILVDGQGGTDIVTFSGSTGDDKYFARPTSGFILNTAFDLEAFNFEQMTGNLLTGAGDLARFFDAAGNDTVTASPTTATIVGAGFTHTANGYDTLLAQSTAGGTDTANLTGSTGDDLLSGGLGTATLGAAGVSLQMLSFEVVTSNGVSGLDIARFTGSAGNDTFTAGPTSASFVGTGFNLSTTNFDRHFATGGGGAGDVADFTDSAGNDLFTGVASMGTLSGTGFIQQATSGFETIRIRGTSGGTNTRSLTNPLFLLQQFGTWR